MAITVRQYDYRWNLLRSHDISSFLSGFIFCLYDEGGGYIWAADLGTTLYKLFLDTNGNITVTESQDVGPQILGTNKQVDAITGWSDRLYVAYRTTIDVPPTSEFTIVSSFDKHFNLIETYNSLTIGITGNRATDYLRFLFLDGQFLYTGRRDSLIEKSKQFHFNPNTNQRERINLYQVINDLPRGGAYTGAGAYHYNRIDTQSRGSQHNLDGVRNDGFQTLGVGTQGMSFGTQDYLEDELDEFTGIHLTGEHLLVGANT